MNSYIAIGDIHGEATKLREILSSISGKYKEYIFLGDYVDRGLESKDVIESLLDFSKDNKCIFIKGNHERFLMDYFSGGDILKYARVGGLETIYSYTKERAKGNIHKVFREVFCGKHRAFIEDLKDNYVIGNTFFTHDASKIKLNNDIKKVVHGHGDSPLPVNGLKYICLNQKRGGEIEVFSSSI